MKWLRLKDVVRINSRVLPESTNPALEFWYIDIGAVGRSGEISIPAESLTFASAPSRARRLAPAGATIVSTVRTYLGAIAQVPMLDRPLVFSTGFAVLEPGSDIDARFLTYYCQSDLFVQDVISRSVGVNYPVINPSELASIRIPLPSMQEQCRIADFLDEEIGRMDEISSLKRRMILVTNDRLDVWRERIFVDSAAVSWVPVMYLTERSRPIVYGIVQAGPDVSDGVPYIKTGDLPNIDPAKLSRTSWSIHLQYRRAAVRPGDIVIAMRASIGAVSIVPPELTVANLTQGTARISPAPGIDSRWLYYALQVRRVQEQCQIRAVGSTFRTLNIWDLRRILVPLVPDSLRTAQVANFEGIYESHQELEKMLKRQVRLISEHKQALITAAVTGQLDVATAQSGVRV